MTKRIVFTVSSLFAASVLLAALAAGAQQQRMSEYENRLEDEIRQSLDQYRRALQGEEVESEALERAAERAQGAREAADDDDLTEAELSAPFESTINVQESRDGQGQDVEIRLTMPIDAFMEYAPIAALEAAAIPHKFPVVYIYLREETTDRVARVAFRDAEPIAGRYLANDENAVEEMKEALIWH